MTKKPGLPITVIGLVSVAIAGLITQFLAAEHAFGLIGRSHAYSIMAAVLIESAIVIDALTVAKSRNVIALASLILAMIVSAIYNYILADTALTVYTLLYWQKLALAIGPLIALATIGLALGEELYQYEVQLADWSTVLGSQERDTREERAREEAAQRRQRQAELAFEHQLRERELEHKLKEERLATRRKERWDRKAAQGTLAPAPSTNNREPLQKLLEIAPGALDDIDNFVIAALSNRQIADRIKPKHIARTTGKDPRTARRWVARYREQTND